MEFGLVIDGRKRATARHQEVKNPSTFGVAGHMPLGTLQDLDEAVAAAARAFRSWSTTSDAERQAACHAIAAKIEAHAEELAHLITAEQGKQLNGLGSRFEVGGTVAWTHATADLQLPVEVLQDNEGGRIELHRKPIGVIGSITPWNWPMLIASWHIVPAVRTGNTVVIKPSPYTPLSTLRMVELMNEVLPPGVVNCVTGDDELGAALSRHAGISKMVFTGSTATGRKIMACAAPTLKRVTLELGGNDAGVVLPDADPKAIAPGLFWGAFINGGQTCAALKRLYVHDSLYDAVCEALVEFAQTVPMGDGLDENNQLGPIQNAMQFDKVRGMVEEARQAGARILCGGTPRGGDGYFYPITLVADAREGMRLVDEEQFGPVLPILRYTDLEDAMRRANDNPLGLGGSVWGGDTARAKQLAQRLECGITWVNKHGGIQPNTPFGGVKQSGIGVEFGAEGLKEYTVTQTVWV
jgi:acyl-CoA reductase-like NAD-dependent aldehyde dehydrogenase